MKFLPVGATNDTKLLLTTRGLRAFADGLVSTVLTAYLLVLGLSGSQVGVVITVMLLGSAAMTLGVGLRGHRFSRRKLLLVVSLLMVTTGVLFGLVGAFWTVLVVAFVGTVNPSSGDVSVFLPTEQALLPSTVPNRERTAAFAVFSVVAFVMGAVGSLAAAIPDRLQRGGLLGERAALRTVFVAYAAVGVVIFLLYRRISPAVEPPKTTSKTALGASRSIVYRLAAVFAIDSFGGGFVVQTIVALWLSRRFAMSLSHTGLLFFVTGICSGLSALLAPRLAERIGLIRTMAYTHLPANVFLMAAAFMPNVKMAVACLVARSLLSQMDVPARQSYVMAVVSPEERPAAASVTNVPRSLASAIPPFVAGWMLDHSHFGWPLVIGGGLKAAYDLVLLVLFRNVRPPEETSNPPLATRHSQ